MPRGVGVHNRDYEAKRAALLARAVAALLESPEARLSLREIAARLEVSVPTLRHYFGDREGLVAAAMGAIAEAGAPYLAAFAQPSGPLRDSLTAALNLLAQGFLHGNLERAHTLGFAEGLQHARLGPAYLERLLEPTLEAMRARLAAHRARGELSGGDDGHLALLLVAPVVFLLLRRGALGGGRAAPEEVAQVIEEAVAGVVWAHGRGTT